LSGGVVRGAAHVGVLSVLERAGVPIDCVAGASAGALIGALYCAGVGARQLQEMAAQFSWRKIARPVWPNQGFVSFDRLERWLIETIGDLRFSDLKRPFAVVTTDLRTGQPVTIGEGRVAPAVHASCAVPGFVTPTELNGRLLGDGGASRNLPAAAVRAFDVDYVIGVDLLQPVLRKHGGPLRFGMIALEALIQQSGGGLEAVDCLISPKLAGATYLRFSEFAELFTLGAQAAEDQLEAIRSAMDSERVRH
jgi:NTE family protein